MAHGMKHLSTHVLDLTRGKPAAAIRVRFDQQEASGGWRQISSGQTNEDGRCGQLADGQETAPGIYRLVFDTGTYFGALNIASLYPVIEVVFELRAEDLRLHIPLLLSPNGYTTYRGS
jgi:5-hydroxyisourate hydrolase